MIDVLIKQSKQADDLLLKNFKRMILFLVVSTFSLVAIDAESLAYSSPCVDGSLQT